jgi:DNA polymerase III sliding clamp (beta) subunit (PCNA family)
VKFRCERDVLGEAFSTAGRSVATRGGPAAGSLGVRIEVDGNKLVVVGTDLDLTMRVELEVVGLDAGAFVAPARWRYRRDDHGS